MTFEELLEDARTIPETELRESVLRFLTQPRRQPTYDEIQYGKTLAAQALERGASMTPDEVTLNKIRERHDGYFVPTDLDTPTCSACFGDVSVRDGNDWNDGDLCDNCAGLAASGQYADIDALLRLLDEASWKPIETAPFDEQMTARERLAIVIAARLGDTSNMTNDAVSAVVAKELANWAPIK